MDVRNLSRKTEDYLEAILTVSWEKGYAKTKDVAEELHVSPPSVVEMFRKLDKRGLIRYRRYEGVTLTPEGREIAEQIKDRHETIKAFLTLINVSEEVADRDACIMEHELDSTTIEQLKEFVAFLNSHFYQPDTLKLFDKFCRARKVEQGGA
jgi:DtxR family Mn-dependent transcriptional regulator